MPRTTINFKRSVRVVIIVKNGNAEIYSDVPVEAMVIDNNFDGVEDKDLTKFHVKQVKLTAYANLQDASCNPDMVDAFWKQSKLAG
jgi:hypothetical protein